MFKLLRVSVSAVALSVSLWLPHCSQNTRSLSPATTCKLPRDLTSRVLHRELAERTEAVNVPHTQARVAAASWLLHICMSMSYKIQSITSYMTLAQ